MSRSHLGNRVDANHADVKAWYEELFCTVIDLSSIGFGCPDLLVQFSGVNDLVEVKVEDGDLTPAQKRFIRENRGGRVRIVTTRDDVIAHVTIRRAQISRGTAMTEPQGVARDIDRFGSREKSGANVK